MLIKYKKLEIVLIKQWNYRNYTNSTIEKNLQYLQTFEEYID